MKYYIQRLIGIALTISRLQGDSRTCPPDPACWTGKEKTNVESKNMSMS